MFSYGGAEAGWRNGGEEEEEGSDGMTMCAAFQSIVFCDSKIERCLKNLELLNRLLDLKLIDFDEKRKNSHEKYDVRANFEAQLSRNRADLKSHKSKTSDLGTAARQQIE